jgi:hypothetical protein
MASRGPGPSAAIKAPEGWGPRCDPGPTCASSPTVRPARSRRRHRSRSGPAISAHWWKFSTAGSLDGPMMLKLVGAPNRFRYVTAGGREPPIAPRLPLDFVLCLFLACGMARDGEPIHPMTLGNMRRNGVRGLCVTCSACGRHTEVNVDAWPDDVSVPSFGPRMRCTKCGNLGADARPNWIERADRLPGGTRRG